jgi:hypothetical protein
MRDPAHFPDLPKPLAGAVVRVRRRPLLIWLLHRSAHLHCHLSRRGPAWMGSPKIPALVRAPEGEVVVIAG